MLSLWFSSIEPCFVAMTTGYIPGFCSEGKEIRGLASHTSQTTHTQNDKAWTMRSSHSIWLFTCRTAAWNQESRFFVSHTQHGAFNFHRGALRKGHRHQGLWLKKRSKRSDIIMLDILHRTSVERGHLMEFPVYIYHFLLKILIGPKCYSGVPCPVVFFSAVMLQLKSSWFY